MDTTPARHQRILEIFEATFEAPPDERDRILEAECADDPDLRLEVERVIAKHEADGTFLDRPVLGRDFRVTWETLLEETPADRIGQQIGDFTLRRVIATGGMGTVYEAEQDRPRRTLAVKVMKRGITSPSALKRFEYEAQILAHLRHPGIAHVYEAGRCGQDGDVPYFAMELIADAKPITGYAKGRKLDTRQRLDLFTKVCDAVHHGHQKGVIHRDLKPSNILVDAEGEPKVIDFGVARATDSDMAITTLQTDVGQLIGTLQYMSPEQCEGRAHDLDTRSDVYSLGVVLYELLCDQVPYDVSSGTVPQAIQVIREETPARPSTINRTLRGDLETITLKALEKERQRRYDSAAALADDIRRYLNDEPIVARPASAIYQLRKFARRNRGIVAATAIALTALLSALVVSIHFAVRESRASAEAVQQTAVAEAVSDFVTDDLLGAVLGDELGPRATMLEVVNAAAATIDERFHDQPIVKASIAEKLGEIYLDLTEYGKAREFLQAAVDLRQEHLGETHRDTLNSMAGVGVVLYRQGRYAEAEELYRHLLSVYEDTLGPRDPETLRSMSNIMAQYLGQGRYAQAEALGRRTLELRREVLGDEHVDTIHSMRMLGRIYTRQLRFAEAETLTRQVLEASKRVHGESHVRTVSVLTELANILRHRNQAGEAALILEEVLRIRREFYGENHVQILTAMNGLANAFRDLGRLDEAEELYVSSLAEATRTIGESNPETVTFMANLGSLQLARGDFPTARATLADSLKLSRELLGNDHPSTQIRLSDLAKAEHALEHYREEESLLKELLPLRQQRFGETSEQAISVVDRLANLYDAWDKSNEAAEWRAKLPEPADDAAPDS